MKDVMLKNLMCGIILSLSLSAWAQLIGDVPVEVNPGNGGLIDFPLPAPVNTDDELRRLYRCHAIFSSTRIASNHYLIAQVKNNSKTGTQACMELFDSAAIGANGKVNENNQFAKNTIAKMHQMHKNFYMTKDFWDAFDPDHTPNLIDLYEGANFLTWMLLRPQQDFNKVMLYNKGYKAIRNSTGPSTRMLHRPDLALHFTHGYDQASEVPYTPNTLIQEGILVGFTEDNTVNPASSVGSWYGGNYNTTNPNRHMGGGLLGLPSYLLANYGSRFGIKPNGVSHQYRRISRNIVKDFLCRDLPVVRETDVTSYIVPTSNVTFRKASSCVACHATIDRMAGVYRNQITVKSVRGGTQGFTYIRQHVTDRAHADIFPSGGDDNQYHRRPPNGKLFFRSYDGTLIDEDITSISDLGSKLIQTNDLPVCFAAKYYKAFTGIEANLADLGNPNTNPLTEGEKYHREKVIQLGLALKEHRNLRTLIQDIISTNAFINTHHKEDP